MECELDMCCSTAAAEVLLPNERCHKESVDGALTEENERAGLMMPPKQGRDGDREAREQVSAVGSEEILAWQGLIGEISAWDSCPASGCSPRPVVSDEPPSFVSPGDASCEVVLLCEEVEDEEQCIAEPGAGSTLLSAQGEIVAEKVDGQQFVMYFVSPVQAGPGQQDM